MKTRKIKVTVREPRTRDRLVRELSPSEAGSLLVHAHSISPERRKALLFVRGPANAYFAPSEQASIRDWIEKEQLLTQDAPFDHPKAATYWCDYCGHVQRCKHLIIVDKYGFEV